MEYKYRSKKLKFEFEHSDYVIVFKLDSLIHVIKRFKSKMCKCTEVNASANNLSVDVTV